jgi:hypothetical protein
MVFDKAMYKLYVLKYVLRANIILFSAMNGWIFTTVGPGNFVSTILGSQTPPRKSSLYVHSSIILSAESWNFCGGMESVELVFEHSTGIVATVSPILSAIPTT